jgi:hypothetical protein
MLKTMKHDLTHRRALWCGMWGLTLLLVPVCWVPGAAATPAVAPSSVPTTGHGTNAQKKHEHHYFMGIKGGYLAGFHKVDDGDHGETHTYTSHLGGAGIFAEFTLVRRWLELEICFMALGSNHGAVLPFDILFKIPFHVNRWFHLFVGLGPAMAVAVEDGHTTVHFGGASVLGAYFWIHKHVGLLVEVRYNLLYEHGPLHEVGGGAGVVVGW